MTRSTRARWLAFGVLAVSIALVGAAVAIVVLSSLVSTNRHRVASLEAQVTQLCAGKPDCRPVTQAPTIVVVTPTSMVAPTTVPFPPSTLRPSSNQPASAPPAPSPAPEPSTTTTTAPPPPTTTPTTTCTSLPVVGCVGGRASRSSTSSRGSPNWSALRQCENGGRYTSAPSDYYRGAYQAERGTWDGFWSRHGRDDLVGTDPADATPDDQDAFAVGLYAERGRSPWPSCGWLL